MMWIGGGGFDDFCLVAERMKDKKHLNKKGLEEIKKNQS